MSSRALLAITCRFSPGNSVLTPHRVLEGHGTKTTAAALSSPLYEEHCDRISGFTAVGVAAAATSASGGPIAGEGAEQVCRPNRMFAALHAFWPDVGPLAVQAVQADAFNARFSNRSAYCILGRPQLRMADAGAEPGGGVATTEGGIPPHRRVKPSPDTRLAADTDVEAQQKPKTKASFGMQRA